MCMCCSGWRQTACHEDDTPGHGGNDLGHLALTAEANGRSATLQWVVANSDDWDRDECLAEAGTHEVRDWIEAFQPAGGDL